MVGPSRRYQILEVLGKGAFGRVYRARLSSTDGFVKEVAIKLLKADLDPEIANDIAARQRDEARLLALVRHRAILHVDGLVQLDGTWAVVMEYVDGADLNTVLRHDRIPPAAAVGIAAEVAGALRAAYEATAPDGAPVELIHRDIKPSNIAVTARGDVKLLDFGIARARFEHREAKTTGVRLGTLRYMAPERLDAIDGPEGDVYALGVVLVETLTGASFHKTSSNRERHLATIAEAMRRLTEVLPSDDLHERLTRLVATMLDFEPSARPVAREAEAALRALRLPSEGLSTWSDRVVPQVRASQQMQDVEQLVGMTLVERTGTTIVAGLPSRRPRWLWLLPALGVVLVGVALLGVGGLVLWSLEPAAAPSVRQDAPPVVEATVPAPVAPSPEPVAVTPVDAPEPEPIRRPRPAPAPSPPPAPAPAPEEAEEVPEVPSTGRFEVSGADVAVRLVGEAGSFSPGEVPPGAYTVHARFGDGAEMEVGETTIYLRETRTLLCDPVFQNCRFAP